MTVLAASQLALRRGGRVILDAIDFRGESGEFIAVIGPNGAGKSSLLLLLAGLLKPDAGEIHFDGRPLAALSRSELATRRSYLPQNPRCEWPISVERLIGLGLTPILPDWGRLPASFGRSIEVMLEVWDLAERRNQAVTTLSAGELMRAMLARALVSDPQVLIADEPVSGLDPRHALATIRRLRALADGGKLVIAAVHDVTLAARHATRMAALFQGRLVAAGRPRQVLTAALLRTIFKVEAHVEENARGLFVDFGRPTENEAMSGATR